MAPRGQVAVTVAPPPMRLWAETTPPVCSIRVLAMKNPRPMPSCLPSAGFTSPSMGLRRAGRAQPHLLAGEIRGVLDQISQAVQDFRHAPDLRRGTWLKVEGDRHVQTA